MIITALVTMFLATVQTAFTVLFGLNLLGMSLGNWMIAFIVLDLAFTVLLFRSKSDLSRGS